MADILAKRETKTYHQSNKSTILIVKKIKLNSQKLKNDILKERSGLALDSEERNCKNMTQIQPIYTK